MKPGYQIAKRALDLVAAVALLVILAPLLAAAAVAVRLDSNGPAIFLQLRVGRGRRSFRMAKFRTMRAGGDDEVLREHLERLAAGERGVGRLRVEDDPRITRVGRLLRRWSIDELPNLWNVVRGEMSLVGPRPLVPFEVELLGDEAAPRFLVRPGITGLAQIEGRDELDIEARTRHDLEYVQNRSMALDLRILARTAAALVRTPG